ncbi:MAG: glycosyltransferase family 1 protein [Candidatus Andersenbacteria bacterium]
MRIGIDIRSLEEAQPTGVGEYTRAVVRELLALAPDHEFRLYASGARQVELPDIGVEQHPRATVKWLQRPNKLRSASTVLVHRPVLDEVLGGLDVFFSPNLNFTTLSPTVPHVLTVHDLSFELFPRFFSLRRRVWHRAVRARQAVRTAAHVLCDSRSTADDVTTIYGVPRARTTVVPLGVDASFAAIDDVQAAHLHARRVREQLELPERYVLAVGTIEPRKNLVTLVRAWEAARRRTGQAVALVVAGPDGWKSRAFWSAVGASEFADDVHVLGFVASSDRPALLRGASCVVAASSYEGFAPALEAMACGVPVVAADASSLPEVSEDAALLVDPERPAQVADAAGRGADRRGRCAPCWWQRGWRRPRWFTWRDTARATLNVLLEAVVDNRRWQLEPSTARSAIVSST